MSQLYEIVVLSEESKKHTDTILDHIDPKGRISHRLYRQHCISVNDEYLFKSCSLLGRPLNQLVMVDDERRASNLQPHNFYHIEMFTGSRKDRKLCHLSAFLKHIAAQPAITSIEK